MALGSIVELVLLEALANPRRRVLRASRASRSRRAVACFRSSFTSRRFASSAPATNTSVVIGSGVSR